MDDFPIVATEILPRRSEFRRRDTPVCVAALVLSVVLILPLLFVVHYHFPKLDARLQYSRL